MDDRQQPNVRAALDEIKREIKSMNSFESLDLAQELDYLRLLAWDRSKKLMTRNMKLQVRRKLKGTGQKENSED